MCDIVTKNDSTYVHFPIDAPIGYFCTTFAERVPSRYTDLVSFRSGMEQEEVLSSRLGDDYARMKEVSDSIVEHPHFERILY